MSQEVQIIARGELSPEEAQRIVWLLGRLGLSTEVKNAEQIKSEDRKRLIEQLGIASVAIGIIPEFWAELSIAELELTTRAWNALRAEGITTIGQLGSHTMRELRDIPNLGIKTMDSLLENLDEHGLLIPELSLITPEEERLYTYTAFSPYR